jgi:plasmid stability protein
MATLVIESFPESLQARIEKNAAAHRRSVPQEAIHLLETALAAGEPAAAPQRPDGAYWATRRLQPEYEAALRSGAFRGGTDSNRIISEEREAR